MGTQLLGNAAVQGLLVLPSTTTRGPLTHPQRPATTAQHAAHWDPTTYELRNPLSQARNGTGVLAVRRHEEGAQKMIRRIVCHLNRDMIPTLPSPPRPRSFPPSAPPQPQPRERRAPPASVHSREHKYHASAATAATSKQAKLHKKYKRSHIKSTNNIIHHQQVRLCNSYQRTCLRRPHLQ